MESINLEKYYLGDDAWKNFYTLYENLPDTLHHNKLNELFNDITLVKVIEGKMGKTAMDWIARKIPALDNLRPIDCIDNTALLKRLKTMLMRM